MINKIKYNNGKVSVRVYVCVYLWVMSFKVTQYLDHFKSEFDAAKSNVGLLLENLRLALPIQCLFPLFGISDFLSRIFDIAKISPHTSKPIYL